MMEGIVIRKRKGTVISINEGTIIREGTTY